jgi:hypothetical protein
MQTLILRLSLTSPLYALIDGKESPHMASDQPKYPIYGGGDDPVRSHLVLR